MSRTIDARIFYLLPDGNDRKRMETLTQNEVCEAFILEQPEIVKRLLQQQDKSLLVLDTDTFPEPDKLMAYAEGIVSECGDKLIRLFIVGKENRISEDGKILWISREVSDIDENLKNIITELNLWGMRSYIRFGSQKSRIAFFRMKFGEKWRTGVIHDISASGMSCSFDRHSDISVTEKSSSIELCIRESIFRLTGSFLLRRTFKNTNMFVVVFSAGRSKEHIKRLNSIIFKLTRTQTLERIEKLAAG